MAISLYATGNINNAYNESLLLLLCRPMPYEQPRVLLRDINRFTEIKGTASEDYAGYEMLDKYNRAYEEIPRKLPDQRGLPSFPSSAGADYDITQCPAYVSVAHGNQKGQQAETSLMHPYPAPGTTATKDSSEMSAWLGKHQDQDGNSEDNETYWNVAASNYD